MPIVKPGGGSHHRVEEVAEFLRRIPEAAKNEVLIVAMTNRVEMIDPAIMRRGRFDHVIKVDFASEKEVRALLDKTPASLSRWMILFPQVLLRNNLRAGRSQTSLLSYGKGLGWLLVLARTSLDKHILWML